MNWFQTATLCITAVGLINCIIFCIGYWHSSSGSWFNSEYGRFLMMFIGCMGSLFALIVANRVFGMWPGRLVVTLILYSTYVGATFWPLRLLWLSNYKRRVTVGKHQRSNRNEI